MRQLFVDVFAKSRAGTPLTSLETVISDVIDDHPEYHDLLQRGDVDSEYTVEMGQTNPFLHMAMHIAIREQVQTDRPAGIRSAWERLATLRGNAHAAEHAMLECLGEALANSQSSGLPPDEQAYLDSVRQL